MKKKLFAGMATMLLFFCMDEGARASTIIYTNANLGDYSNDTVNIPLSGLAPHSSVTVNFDLYIMDSWDGTAGAYAPDYFGFSVDGDSRSWTFYNFTPGTNETNTVSATSIGDYNSITSWGSIDRYFQNYNGGFTVTHSSDTMTLSFFGTGLQGLTDESWRVTNLVVTSNAVPEPASVALLGVGGVAVAMATRRKAQVA
jgi:hypothetical protein